MIAGGRGGKPNSSSVPEGDWSDTLYRELAKSRPTKEPIRLIPYFAWANRGVSEMTVFMPVC